VPEAPNHLCVVLVSTRNPLNIGAAARAMSNFGFSDLRLVNPYGPSFREARSAVGAADLLKKAKVFSSVAEAIADCTLVVGTTAGRARELQHELKRLEDGAPLIRRHLSKGSVALLFGSEKVGLSNEDFSHCHWLMRIPTIANVSMNLGQAVALCLYELVRRAPIRKQTSEEVAPTADELERITNSLMSVLKNSGYLKGDPPASSEQKIRRMVRRLDLMKEDADLWLGMLRQIAWKIGQKR